MSEVVQYLMRRLLAAVKRRSGKLQGGAVGWLIIGVRGFILRLLLFVSGTKVLDAEYRI